jgi:hypothetical protein
MTDQRTFTLHQADQPRTDFAVIEDELEAIHARLARVPTRTELAPTALGNYLLDPGDCYRLDRVGSALPLRDEKERGMTRAGVLGMIAVVLWTGSAVAGSKEKHAAAQTMAKCLQPLVQSVASAKPTSDQISVMMRKRLQEAIQQARSSFWTDDPKVGLDGASMTIEGMARAVEIASLEVNSDE